MIRFVIGGQMEKEKIRQKIADTAGDAVSIVIKNDMDAAMAVKQNDADFYLGACHTGGGAIAMAMALVGRTQCVTVSSPGNPPKEEDIAKYIREGKKVFGFTIDHIDLAVPMLVKHITAYTAENGEA